MQTKTFPLAVITALFITLSCVPKAEVESEKPIVTKIVNEFYRSFEQQDIDLMGELMAHDESMLSFGTSISDLHPSWTAWRENHIAQFEAIDEAKINSRKLNVYLSQKGDVAWFADVSDWTVTVQGDTIQLNDIRITGVLEKRDSVWKIVQIHASVPQTE